MPAPTQRIIEAILDRPRTTPELHALLGGTRSVLWGALRALEAAGVVAKRTAGKQPKRVAMWRIADSAKALKRMARKQGAGRASPPAEPLADDRAQAVREEIYRGRTAVLSERMR